MNLRRWLSGAILGAFFFAGYLPSSAAQETARTSVDQVFARYALFNVLLVRNGSRQANWLGDGMTVW